MKYLLLIFSIFFILQLTKSGLIFAQNEGVDFQEETMEGEIVKVLEEKNYVVEGTNQIYQRLAININKGSLSGRTVEIESGNLPTAASLKYKAGDKVVIIYSKDIEGRDMFLITDFVRRDGLIVLFIIFAMLSIIVGGTWGAMSLLGMVFSFFIIFKFILPQIISGRDAVLIAVIGSAIIIPVTFSLSHGIKRKTYIAAAATIITLLFTGILAAFFVNLTRLSGFSADEAGYLQFETGSILNMRGILLAGFIIASLGILDDITISQASVIQEIKKANNKYRFTDLFSRGMNVGRDHIASLVNTLVLVYTGASLPLLLLFINNPQPVASVMNHEFIAEEIVRTLVGSIGLVLAVPITSALAAFYYQKS